MAARTFVESLFGEQLERGIEYFFPDSVFEITGRLEPSNPQFIFRPRSGGGLEFEWLDTRYALTNAAREFTAGEKKLLKAIGRVLSVRHQVVFNADLAALSSHLFRGVPEDRYVSAFLDPSFYRDLTVVDRGPDRIADAIEVLRISSLSTYENRRIATGVLLFGSQPDPCHVPPPLPQGALPYSVALTSIRSFHRICDGLQTLALVDRSGLLVELMDVLQWAQPYAEFDLPVPSTARYLVHSRATLCGGHSCLVLTPNGEIKIFADGAQVFSFLGGRWRLTDMGEKYELWRSAIGDEKLAQRLFTVALNLAEDRRGGLFVILDDAESSGQLLAASDLLRAGDPFEESRSKNRLHYLLLSQSVTELAPTVLESVARIDGAIVLDRASRLIAFGAILRHNRTGTETGGAPEGGRTTAALAASEFGSVLKVSEDGLISYFRNGRCIWEI